MKKLIIFAALCVVVIISTGLWHLHRQNTQSNKTSSTRSKSFNKKQFSLNDPESIWVIVNKNRQLQPRDYTPNDLTTPKAPLRYSANDPRMSLRTEAAKALETLVDSAKTSGLHMMVASAYRSYTTQVATYNSEVKAYGVATADRESARPGYSEHQTGWAVDLAPVNKKCFVQACFADTPEGKWLAQHAHEYGFILRYQKDKQNITGYIFEPWHIRFVGKSLANEINRQGNPTLEEFFGLDRAPEYR